MTLAERRRDLPLTISAVLGALVVLASVALAVTHSRPVAFRSGSMSPTIPTGAAALVHRVPADELGVGDVVTVPSGHTFVTHRIVQLTLADGTATLQLKGDANPVADPSLYRVESAERVVGSTPWVGYLLGGVSGRAGLFLAGVHVLWLLRRILRGAPAQVDAVVEARHRGERVLRPWSRLVVGGSLATLALAGVAVAGAPRALAAGWADSATVAGTALTAYAVGVPSGSISCANGSAGSRMITFSWPPTAGAPAGYGYQLEVWTKPLLSGGTLLRTYTTSATQQAVSLDDLNRGLYVGSGEVVLRGQVAGGAWRSSTTLSRPFVLGVLSDIRCD